MRLAFSLGVCVVLLLGGTASASPVDALLPQACVPETPGESAEVLWPKEVPIGDTIGSGAALEAIARRLAAERGIGLREARSRVARFAASHVLSPDEAGYVLETLRSLWQEGDGRVLVPYALLAGRFPSLGDSSSAGDMLAVAATQGDAEALLRLARLRREDGSADPDGVAGLVEQARAILWARAMTGDCGALVSLAQLKLDPIVGKAEPHGAVELLAAGVARRFPAAAERLAALQLSGNRVAYDPENALKLLRAAVQWGSPTALVQLVQTYLGGPLPLRDHEEARRLAAGAGSSGAEADPGLLILLAEDAAGRFGGEIRPERVRELLTAVEQDPHADDYRLAVAYLQGWSGQIVIGAAEAALERSARTGNRDALWKLAELRLLGGVPGTGALRLLREAAVQGSVPAMLRLRGMAAAGTADPEIGGEVREMLVGAARAGSDAAAEALATELYHEVVFAAPGTANVAALEAALHVSTSHGSLIAALELDRAYQTGLLARTSGHALEEAMVDALPPNPAAGPEKMLKAARAYAGGTSFAARPELALDWLHKCMDLGEPRCFSELGSLAGGTRFEGVIDPAEAAQAMRIAGEAGDAGALFVTATAGSDVDWTGVWRAARLGHLPAILELLRTTGADRMRIDEAVGWFEWSRALAAADLDQTVALGRAYRDGRGLPRDSELAMETLLLAAHLGNATAMRDVGTIQIDQPDPDLRSSGRIWLERAAELGDVEAMQRLSDVFYEGELGLPDPERGFRYARLAALRGAVEAKQRVAEALETGFGTGASGEAAQRWLAEAADEGVTAAMVKLGEHALADTGADADAYRWFRKAAERGDPRAMFFLGKMYEEGRYVARDLKLAEGLYTKAADEGHLPSVLRLSSLRDADRGLPFAATAGSRVN